MNSEPCQSDSDDTSKSQAANPLEPPIVVFHNPNVPHNLGVSIARTWTQAQSLLHAKTYGAPRVFDLFTLMSITLAFGLLFALMKAMDAIPEVFVSVTAFVTLVAVAQMTLFGGSSPRIASLLGGPLALFCVIVGLGLWYREQAGPYAAMICILPLGVPFGYLAGGMIAGVFLIGDQLRSRFSATRIADDNASDSLWN